MRVRGGESHDRDRRMLASARRAPIYSARVI
jgi:hypothetical protein